MTNASKSVYYFSFYLLLTGLALIVSPNLLLAMVGLPPATEPWIRVLGTVVIGLGLFYNRMAGENNTMFLILTVYGRVTILIWFSLFIALGWAPWQLVLFGLIDAFGALWTYMAIKNI